MVANTAPGPDDPSSPDVGGWLTTMAASIVVSLLLGRAELLALAGPWTWAAVTGLLGSALMMRRAQRRPRGKGWARYLPILSFIGAAATFFYAINSAPTAWVTM